MRHDLHCGLWNRRLCRSATKDETFAPRRHGDTEEKDKWIPSGPVVHLRFRPRADRRYFDLVSPAERKGHGKTKAWEPEKQRHGNRKNKGMGLDFRAKIVESCEDFQD